MQAPQGPRYALKPYPQCSPPRPTIPTPTDKPSIAPGVHRAGGAKVHGFGLEGEPAVEEVLLAVRRERPATTEAIMAGTRTQVGGAVCFAVSKTILPQHSDSGGCNDSGVCRG